MEDKFAPLEPKGKDLIRWLGRVAEQGHMNPNTAGGLKAGSKDVLSTVLKERWEEENLDELDIEGTLERFERLSSARLSPGSLGVYKTRFRNAVKLYRDYLENPSGWKYKAERPAAQRKSARKANAVKPSGENNGLSPEPAREDYQGPPGIETLSNQFRIRPGFTVTLRLPADLRKREAEKLSAFIGSLAADEEDTKQLPAGRG